MADAGKGRGKEKGKGEELEMEESGGKNKKLIMIAGAVLILVALGVGGAMMFMGGDDRSSAQEATLDDDNGSGQTGGAAAQASVGVGTALYVAMPRPFIFNVPGSARDRHVQIKVQLLVRGDAAEEEAKRHIPLIEAALLKTFSGTNADDLATTRGKDALKIKALQDVQTTMVDITGKKIIEQVLFTGFVMQ